MASQFSNYTTKELLTKLKKQKKTALLQAVLILMMLIFSVFYTVEKGFSFLSFLPLFFIPMLFVMANEMKNIKKELASRK